jgi:transcriptional regulator with XRE-family HTH domain
MDNLPPLPVCLCSEFPIREKPPMLVSDLQQSIKDLVRAKIESRQLSQEALGKRIHVGQAHVSLFLQGRRGLSIESMDAILKVLQLEVADLLPSRRFVNPPKETVTFEDVPLVDLNATMLPSIADDRILGLERFGKARLSRIRHDSPKERKSWLRFVAVRIDSDCSGAFSPSFSRGAVCLIDRHYCSLKPYRKGKPNLYLVRRDDEYVVRRLEMLSTSLCLRPDGCEQPLEFIPITRKQPLESCVAGRVAHIGGEV